MPAAEGGDVAVAAARGTTEEDRALLCARVREYLADNRVEHAWQVADAAFKQSRTCGDKKGEATACLMQALVRASIDDSDPQDTVDVAKAAAAALREVGDPAGELEALRLTFGVQLKWGQFDAARQSAGGMVKHCEQAGDAAETAAAHLAVAEACLAGGQQEEAMKAASRATALYEQAGSKGGRASCQALLARALLRSGEPEDAAEAAAGARRLYREVGDLRGQASALQTLCGAHLAGGRNVEGLRAAEEAAKLWRAVGDAASEVDALVAQAEAKVNICEERTTIQTYATSSSLLRAAEAALAAARARRAHDRSCVGSALYVYARVLLKTSALKGAWLAAKGAARAFRKANDNAGRARAQLLWANADLALGYLGEARGNAQAALAFFEKAAEERGISQALEVCEQIDRAMGIPTQGELEEQQRQELLQQQMFMQQQHQQQGQFQGMPQQQVQAIQQNFDFGAPEGQALAHAAPSGAFKRDGASPLKVSSGMDPAVIQAKVMELAAQIIGDPEGIDLDTPLLEAGLTSNTAVILRDELSKDLPGIKLPPTLIFDYPSVGAIADFVLDSQK